jgi:folate-binding protein YgfZ
MDASMPQPVDAANAVMRFLPLADYAFLACEGARTAEFLQGQLSCDVRAAGADRAIPGAICTLQGRVIASFLLWQPEASRMLLRLRADLAPDTAAHLAKYAVFSRTRIDVHSPLAVIGLLGPLARWMETPQPAAAHAIVALEQGWLLRRDMDGAVHELWVPADARAAWLARLAAQGEPGNADAWAAALVRLGDAEIRTATRAQFLPQMLGYDRSGAVSFRKGCYTGQEVVARAQYKGSVKRRLRRLRGEGAAPPPGTELRSGERSAGTVVESAQLDAETVVALAVLSEEAAQGGEPLLTEDGSARLRVAGDGQGPL